MKAPLLRPAADPQPLPANSITKEQERNPSVTSTIALRFQQCLAAGVVFLLSGLALAAQSQAASGSAAPQVEWKTYTYSSDGFSVSFPAEPQIQKQNVPTDAGGLELRTFLATPGSAALYVGVCNYGSAVAGRDPESVLNGARNGAINNAKAHMITEGKITLGDYSGLEFEAESDNMHFSVRIYLVGATLYQLLTAAPSNDRYAGSARFLNSFQLIPRVAK